MSTLLAMQSAVLARGILSVCPSVRPSRVASTWQYGGDVPVQKLLLPVCGDELNIRTDLVGIISVV